MMIIIDKSTLLEIFLAALIGLATGYLTYSVTMVLTWGKNTGPLIPIVFVVATLLGGWGGWELGYWVTH